MPGFNQQLFYTMNGMTTIGPLIWFETCFPTVSLDLALLDLNLYSNFEYTFNLGDAFSCVHVESCPCQAATFTAFVNESE